MPYSLMNARNAVAQIKNGTLSICDLSDAQIAAIWDCASVPTQRLFSALMARCCCQDSTPYTPPEPRIVVGQEVVAFSEGVGVGLSSIPPNANHAEIRSAGSDSLVNVSNITPTDTNSYLVQMDATFELESRDELENFQGSGFNRSGTFVVTYFLVNDDFDQND